MSITSYNTTYYDDYELSGNSDKNYLRVLFKPGYSVQVREINQLQTALQDQISRLGSSIWKPDTAIIGGKTSYLPQLYSITFDLSAYVLSIPVFQQPATADIAAAVKTIKYTGNGLLGSVIGYTVIETGKKYRFYFQYTNTGAEGEIAFDASDPAYQLILSTTDEAGAALTVSGVTVDALGFGAALISESGVFYTKGSFVAVPEQKYFIDKTDADEVLSGYAVLKIEEKIISYFNDGSLLDNASGAPNYSAPGADRYTIDLTLGWITADDYEAGTDSYIKLLLLNYSRPIEIVDDSEYTAINDILAKRTSEESGNYTVNPFVINTSETFDGDKLPVNCIVVGRKYRIQNTGNTIGILTRWDALGAKSPYNVGDEFIAKLPPGDGTAGTADVRGGGTVFDISYQYGVYSTDELDQIGYDITSTAKKLEAIESARAQYSVTLDPSVAYVDGYRIALESSLNLTTKKARESAEFEISTSANIGSYFEGTYRLRNGTASVLPPISNTTTVYELYAYSNASATPDTLTDDRVPIGTCRIKAFESAGSNKYRCYVYDIKFNSTAHGADWNVRRFDNIDQIAGNNFLFNVTSAELLQSTSDTAIFPLPYPQAITATDIKFYVQKYFNGTTTADGTITVTLQTGQQFSDPYDVILTVDGVATTSFTSTLSNSALTLNIAITEEVTESKPYSLIAKIAVNDGVRLARVTKSKEANYQDFFSVDGGSDKIFTLQDTDIIGITSVIATGTKDITAFFKLIDDGQRDNIYTNGRVQYIGSAELTGNFRVTYEYFKRVGGVGGRELVMYTVDSYASTEDSTGTLYDDIPSYKGVKLSDVLDFRQDMLISTATDSYGTPIANIDKAQIDPNSSITLKAEFYLPRIDAVTVNSRNQFSIINGISSMTPVAPAVPKNSMTLYMLEVPAYTPNVKTIVKKYIDNRRYTMRDIGTIESRIRNLEYYSSLSLLEKSATEKSIFDEAGERFKNGILVDNFIGHGIGDVADPQYSCAVDRERGILRPRYNTNNVDLIIDSTVSPITGVSSKRVGSDIRVHDSIITLDYTEVELVSHLKATANISVHPHVYAKINGNIRLSPSADNWKDTVTRPDLVVQDDSAFDAIKFIAEDPALDILGTDWNNWNVEWGGSSTTATQGAFQRRRGIPTTRTTTTNYTASRTGTDTTLSSVNIPKNLGTNVVGTAIIPFIRSRLVFFHATGLKASTRVYPFFEDKDISAYTNQIEGNDSAKFIVPSDVGENITRRYDSLLPAAFSNPDPGFTLYGSQLTTNGEGELYGSFVVPNNDSLRFRTGDRTFKLSDDPRNQSSETTFAFAKYTASGILETVRDTILSTKTPVFNVQPLFQSFGSSVTSSATTYHDPLAQSFLISTDDFPTGAFITSVDLYFAKKAVAQPVEIYVVTMENGAPTRMVVPYSRTFLRPDQVNISENGSAATTFRFSDPVFLKSDEEYAVIVSSNDGDYRCWYAILGESDIITKKRIEKQEYLGTFFTSANAFTWTPQQEQDLKFKINRARFFNPTQASSRSGAIKFATQLHTGIDTITITNGGAGYTVPPTISFGVANTTAKATAILNPLDNTISKIVINDRGYGYTAAPTIVITSAQSGSGPTTPAIAVAKLAEVPVSMYNLRQPNLIFNETEINHSIQFRSEANEVIEAASNVYIPNTYGAKSHKLEVADKAGRAVITSTLVTYDSSISPVIDVDGSSLLTITNLIADESANANEGYIEYANEIVTAPASNTATNTTITTAPAGWTANKWIGKRLKFYDIPALAGKEFNITANTATTITFAPAVTVGLATLTTGVNYTIASKRNENFSSRYITRKVNLNSPSDQLNVYISANRPTVNTNIKVYVKLGFDTSTPDDLLEWVEVSPTNPVRVSSSEDDYKESEYMINPADDFISFQVKVVFISNNIFDIPTVRDFRAIATI